MADIFAEALGRLSGGRVLDLATGEGDFVDLLAHHLRDHAAIVGADADGPAVETAGARFDRAGIRFVQMEGERLAFATGCFDTVAISASLHHLANIPAVLAEAGRVLKPGGVFVLAEMHRDGKTDAQQTLIALHHWVADVASALGLVHNHTLSRQELVDHAQSLGFHGLAYYDTACPEEDPFEESVIRELAGAIDRTLRQAAVAPNHESLRHRGEALRERLHRVGAQSEPVVVIVGRKG
jgi:2-polyprenyl-3-methyl-5-hydroxy-6-metoxy-1,4-benzoquinol methylase